MLHILLVEDNAADVFLVREALRTAPIAADVIIAYDGEQAMKFLFKLNFRPDFIILDLNIPKFDGLAVLERYRAENGRPVVVFTSSLNPDDKKRAIDLGARDYIIKPTGMPKFIEAVHGIVERWGGAAEGVKPGFAGS
jgi:DNA-binding response OmpR family regulator